MNAGLGVLDGRAWSGVAPIVSVEVSVDGGGTWEAAQLDAADSVAGSWIGWTYEWHATPGEYELCCRATDAAGTPQPLHAEWNLGGYANNSVHRVPVQVVGSRHHQA